ncbi:MAG: ThuA domain-containing protein [Armatimonadetes bacterium]|nr:ThuA domain-containing protein [Armatimonadota bacterium]
MPKLSVLLLSGANNHDWTRSTPYVRELMEASGRFTVTVTEDPSAALEDAGALAGYDLIFSDYNGPEWSASARANFEAAVAGGTGLVILHAADNAFPGWVEYEKMVGLLWREGTGHGEFHQFLVRIVDREHPITRGVEDFLQWDELYHRLVHMHGVPYHVLASAYAAPEKGGTGNDEPMMVVTQYGKGRVFHMVLGHVWQGDPNGEYKGASMIAFENPPFQQTLLRGCEWVATGEVTLP